MTITITFELIWYPYQIAKQSYIKSIDKKQMLRTQQDFQNQQRSRKRLSSAYRKAYPDLQPLCHQQPRQRSRKGSSSSRFNHHYISQSSSNLQSIRKSIQRNDHYPTHYSTRQPTYELQNKLSWLQNKSFLERPKDQKDYPRQPQPTDTISQIASWAKIETQLLINELALPNAEKLRQAVTLKQIFGFLFDMVREIAKHIGTVKREEAVRAPDQSLLAAEGKKGEGWGNKVEEVKEEWRNAYDRMLQLQRQLQEKDNQLFRTTMNFESLKRKLAFMENQMGAKNKTEDQIALEKQQTQLEANGKMQVQLQNCSRIIQKLESQIMQKNKEIDKLRGEKSRLVQMYQNLQKQKTEAIRIYQDELLINIKKLGEERKRYSPARQNRFEAFQKPQAKQNNRKQILDTVMATLSTLRRRQQQFVKQQRVLNSSRQKLFQQAIRTSQQLQAMQKECRLSNSRTFKNRSDIQSSGLQSSHIEKDFLTVPDDYSPHNDLKSNSPVSSSNQDYTYTLSPSGVGGFN